MLRYLIVIPALAASLAAIDDGFGSASKEGESLGGLHRADQPEAGSGEFEEAAASPDVPERERMIGAAVLTERELLVDRDAFAEFVFDTLNDDRGWGGDGSVAFVPAGEDADLTIRLATPATVDELCAPLNTNGYTSCRVGDELVLNVDRWAGATEEFVEVGGTLDEYRAYLLNHEAGHYLGHGHVEVCAEDGRAPVMLQQTLDLRGCEPNGWPNIA